MKNNPAISTAFFYGIPTAILLISVFHILPSGDKVYLDDDRVSLLMFLFVCATYIFMFSNHFQKYNNGIPELSQMAILIIAFSFVVACGLGLSHFINAAFIDPSWAENSLVLLQEKWAANNLSKEAIASQVEWTDTFHSSWKWH